MIFAGLVPWAHTNIKPSPCCNNCGTVRLFTRTDETEAVKLKRRVENR